MIKIVACNIVKKEIEYILGEERMEDVIYIDQGLHNEPDKMRIKLQAMIDKIEKEEGDKYTYIALLYGLCGNGTLGLKTSKLKLVIPKAHDCMTLFLGCRHKYDEIIKNNKGSYWYNHAWIDQTPMPSEFYLENIKNDFITHYGEDNGEYLYELELSSLKRYNYGILVKSDIVETENYEKFVRDSCRVLNWEYKEELGNLNLIKNIVNGVFNEDEVLVLQNNEEISLKIIR